MAGWFVTTHGHLELLQLFHGNRRIFLEEARRSSPGVAARLGDYGDLAKGGNTFESSSRRNRPGGRGLPEVAARRLRQALEEPGLLQRRGPGSGRGTTGSNRWKRFKSLARGREGN